MQDYGEKPYRRRRLPLVEGDTLFTIDEDHRIRIEEEFKSGVNFLGVAWEGHRYVAIWERRGWVAENLAHHTETTIGKARSYAKRTVKQRRISLENKRRKREGKEQGAAEGKDA